ncbi:hypothetical protein D3C81_1669630 [compost metagenome]
MYGRTFISNCSAALRSAGAALRGSLPRYCRASGMTSVGASISVTPQSAKRETILGSNSMASEPMGASGMRAVILSTL